MKTKKFISLVLALLLTFVFIPAITISGANDNILRFNVDKIILYALNEGVEKYISIPPSLNQQFQLKVLGTDSKVEWSVSGGTVTIDSSGLIKPVLRESDVFILSTSTMIKVTEYEYGTSVVSARVDGKTLTIEVTVVDYAVYYAEKVMNDYIADNITSDMTQMEKLEQICKFVASYDYNYEYSGYTGMIVTGEGGDCWASTATIMYMCDRVSIQNRQSKWLGVFEHMNVIVFIDGKHYVVEAGINGKAPRWFHIDEVPMYMYTIRDKTAARITGFYGLDTDISIPSDIDGFKITHIGSSSFRGEFYLESIILPDSVTYIGELAFCNCTNLKSITIPESVTSIGENAFWGCSKDLIIRVQKDSHAETYANENKLKFIVGNSSVPAVTATPSSQKVLVNGKETAFDAYLINDSNYFKLRDLAYIFNGTEKQFEVGWDERNNAISLTSNKPYTEVGGEMAGKGSGNKTGDPTTSKIYLDGKEVSFTAYNIDGNNYFKLRDVMKAFNIYVGYNDKTKTITLDTSQGYVD